MKICFVASGSKGNATLIQSETTLIQIDMGVTLKALKEGLCVLNRELSDVQGVFFTHDHSDHIGTVDLFHGEVPLYASKGTLREMEYHEIFPGEGITIGDITILPFAVSHDATNPVNYLIMANGVKFGYVTDTGMLDDDALTLLQNCDYYLFESNHDLKMLMKSKRPLVLKKRIHSDVGHLSNVDSALYLSELITPKTKAIYLGHISEECNTPEIAVATQRRILLEKGVDIEGLEIIPTRQWSPLLGGDVE